MKAFETNSQAFFISMGEFESPQMKQTATGVGQRTKKVQFKHPINQNEKKGGKNHGERRNKSRW